MLTPDQRAFKSGGSGHAAKSDVVVRASLATIQNEFEGKGR